MTNQFREGQSMGYIHCDQTHLKKKTKKEQLKQ